MKWKSKAKHGIAALLFLAIVLGLLLRCTYLFRESEEFSRARIVEFYSEPKDSLDVVFIGGSNVYRYWIPMEAWHDYGITSYDYAVAKMAAATVLASVQDVERHQTPRLIVYDVRKLLTGYEDTSIDSGVQNMLDSQDLTLSRMLGVHYFTQLNATAPREAMTQYLDLMNYHSNHAALSESTQWQLLDNRSDTSDYNKGYQMVVGHRYVSDIESNATDERAPLQADSNRILADLMNYCKNHNIPLLLVASPFWGRDDNTRDDPERMHLNWMELNTIYDLAQDNDVLFLNTLAYYEKMGLDFRTDFHDNNHTNIIGSQKYTEFLGAYIRENFALPDHREDPAYGYWNEQYSLYEEDAAKVVVDTKRLVQTHDIMCANEETMKNLSDASKWFAYADNTDITLLIELDEPCTNALSIENVSLLKRWGLPQSVLHAGNYSAVCINGKAKETGDLNEGISATYGIYSVPYSISRADAITVDGKAYRSKLDTGIHIVGFDNITSTVFDEIVLDIDEQGGLVLQHLRSE